MGVLRPPSIYELPRLWRDLYQGCLDQKFTEDQAMQLVVAFINNA